MSLKPKILFCVLVIFTLSSCGHHSSKDISKETILGSWELIAMSKEPVSTMPVNNLVRGNIKFNEDNTCEGEMSWTEFPNIPPVKLAGKYELQKGVLRITNDLNHSASQTEIWFQGEYLVARSQGNNSFHFYYKKI